MELVILTIKKWNIKNTEKFIDKYSNDHNIHLISNKADLKLDTLDKIKPEFIFVPHWSWIIPEEIISKYFCVIFHMTDLPYGRGGTPLQNLIVRGHKNTKISAIKATNELDAGDILMKTDVSLNGSAEQIYKRISNIIFFEMIPKIMKGKYELTPQTGEPTYFERRTPDQSEINSVETLEQLYDHIRMLDAESYPRAYIKYQNLMLEFSDAELNQDNITCQVKITLEDN